MNLKQYLSPAVYLLIGLLFGALLVPGKFGSGTSTNTIGGNLVVTGTTTFAGGVGATTFSGAIDASGQTVTASTITATGTSSITSIGATNVTTTNLDATVARLTGVTSTNLNVSGNTYVNPKSGTGNIVVKKEVSLTNGTSTPAGWCDTTGKVSNISSVYLYENTSTSEGTIGFIVGTSTDTFTTSTNPFINAYIDRELLHTVSVPTTTIAGGGIILEAGECITVKSTTTTHQGEFAVILQ